MFIEIQIRQTHNILYVQMSRRVRLRYHIEPAAQTGRCTSFNRKMFGKVLKDLWAVALI